MLFLLGRIQVLHKQVWGVGSGESESNADTGDTLEGVCGGLIQNADMMTL